MPSSRWRASALVVLPLALASCRPTPAPVRPPATGLRVVPLGLCEDYPEESRTLAVAREDLRILRGAGVGALRVGIGWDDVEPQPDQFEWTFWDAFVDLARGAHVRLLPYVAYTPKWAARPGRDTWTSPPLDVAAFGDVMARISARYRGRVSSWELWNEPDNREYWTGTAAEFARLVEVGARGVRAGNPAATVVFGGLAARPEFLAETFAAGAGRFVDVVNLHGYFETWNPAPLEAIPDVIGHVAEIIHRHGGRQALWMAEVGYGDHREGGRVSASVAATYAYEHTPAFQAVALVRTLAEILASPEVSLVAWYRVRDLAAKTAVIGDDNNRHLGVTRADGSPKPALAALALMARLFGAGFSSEPASVRRLAGDSAAIVRAFRLADARAVVIAWIPTHVRAAEPAAIRAPTGGAADARAATIEIALGQTTRGEGARVDATGAPAGAVAARHEPGLTVLAPLALVAGEVAVVTIAAP